MCTIIIIQVPVYNIIPNQIYLFHYRVPLQMHYYGRIITKGSSSTFQTFPYYTRVKYIFNVFTCLNDYYDDWWRIQEKRDTCVTVSRDLNNVFFFFADILI